MRRIGIFLRSVALPVCVALLLAILFRPIYLSEGQPNYLLAWICIGFPFGIRRIFSILKNPFVPMQKKE